MLELADYASPYRIQADSCKSGSVDAKVVEADRRNKHLLLA